MADFKGRRLSTNVEDREGEVNRQVKERWPDEDWTLPEHGAQGCAYPSSETAFNYAFRGTTGVRVPTGLIDGQER